MKDFEFITKGELQLAGNWNFEDDQSQTNLYGLINQLLNENAQKGFTSISGTGSFLCKAVCQDVGHKISKDTHEAFVFLRPIEEEKPECDTCAILRDWKP